MKSDILFTTWNCAECSKLKSKINSDAIFDDNFTGNNEQHLTIMHAFSNTGTRVMLEKFEFPDEAITPAIYAYDGRLFWVYEDVFQYLKEQGFVNAEET